MLVEDYINPGIFTKATVCWSWIPDMLWTLACWEYVSLILNHVLFIWNLRITWLRYICSSIDDLILECLAFPYKMLGVLGHRQIEMYCMTSEVLAMSLHTTTSYCNFENQVNSIKLSFFLTQLSFKCYFLEYGV